MVGEEGPIGALPPRARYERETRIAAAVFKQRARLLFKWRREAIFGAARQSSSIPVRQSSIAKAELAVCTNLPRHIAPLRQEIAIWRSFLADQIHAILYEND